MTRTRTDEPGFEDLERVQAVELPKRRLMATVSVLGFPLVGVSAVGANADTVPLLGA